MLSLLILGGTYQFVYVKNMNQVDIMNDEITALESRLSELQRKVNDRDTILAENASIQQEIDGIINTYGNGASEEKSLMMVKNLEDNTDMVIASVTFSEAEYFFNGTELESDRDQSAVANMVTNEEKSEVSVEDLAEADQPVTQEQQEVTQVSALGSLSGYKTTIGITFRISYDGLKKCIDYINHYPEKSNVSDLTLTYDTETGNLAGTMTFNMYHILGPDRSYQEPVIGSIDIGTQNIFGTIGLPVNDQGTE